MGKARSKATFSNGEFDKNDRYKTLKYALRGAVGIRSGEQST
jgi:hypothetical protein